MKSERLMDRSRSMKWSSHSRSGAKSYGSISSPSCHDQRDGLPHAHGAQATGPSTPTRMLRSSVTAYEQYARY
jgi:hypothetical protein